MPTTGTGSPRAGPDDRHLAAPPSARKTSAASTDSRVARTRRLHRRDRGPRPGRTVRYGGFARASGAQAAPCSSAATASQRASATSTAGATLPFYPRPPAAGDGFEAEGGARQGTRHRRSGSRRAAEPKRETNGTAERVGVAKEAGDARCHRVRRRPQASLMATSWPPKPEFVTAATSRSAASASMSAAAGCWKASAVAPANARLASTRASAAPPAAAATRGEPRSLLMSAAATNATGGTTTDRCRARRPSGCAQPSGGPRLPQKRR